MVVKNLQTRAVCAAKTGVRVTGMVCGSLSAKEHQVPFLSSLPWQPLPGYPTRTEPEADRFADENAATARAVQRAGRSASGVGNLLSARLVIIASRTVLSTRSMHAKCMQMARG